MTYIWASSMSRASLHWYTFYLGHMVGWTAAKQNIWQNHECALFWKRVHSCMQVINIHVLCLRLIQHTNKYRHHSSCVWRLQGSIFGLHVYVAFHCSIWGCMSHISICNATLVSCSLCTENQCRSAVFHIGFVCWVKLSVLMY